MGINYAADKFRKDLVDITNRSGLPVCVTKLIVRELLEELTRLERQQIEAEAKMEQQESGAETPANDN